MFAANKSQDYHPKSVKSMYQIDEKSIKISNDGGIDGYGYHRDEDDFRTTEGMKNMN